MATLSEHLDYNDLEVLIESLGHWESSEKGFLDFVNRLRLLGDPPEDVIESAPDGFVDWFDGFKKEMFARERVAKDKQKEKMETACLLKAKLIMKRQSAMDNLSDDLFFGDETQKEIEGPKELPPSANKPEEPKQTHGKKANPESEEDSEK